MVRAHASAVSLRNANGFTITEMMVGLTLGAIGSAVLFSIFIGTQNTYTSTQNIAFGGGDTRAVMGMLSQEIRSAGSDAANIGIQQIAAASPDSLRLLSDLNSNGAIDAAAQPAEDVTYAYNSTDKRLERNTGTGPVVLMDGVRNFRFTFLDAQGNSIANGSLNLQQRSTVRSVSVQMTLDPPDPHAAPVAVETVTTLRNELNEGVAQQ